MMSDTGPYTGSHPDAETESGSGGGTAAAAREGAEQLKHKAVERVEDVRDKAYASKARMAERVQRLGSALRSAGDNLKQQDDDVVARYAEKVSGRIERAAEYLRRSDPQQVLHDVEGFARREPAVFLGGAFLVGLAAARFLKSSRQSGIRDAVTMSEEMPPQLPAAGG